MEFQHVSVLLNECMQNLNLHDDMTIVDCTLGGGGHTEEILKRTKNTKIIAVDKDGDAIEFAKKRLEKFSDRITFVRNDFCNTEEILQQANVEKVDGVLMDLGVSSYQIDNFDRGFSYRAEQEYLDMRMDKSQNFSAFNVVNEYDFNQLTKIFFEYGEEKFSKKIAENIIKYRLEQTIRTCGQLNQIIENSIPTKYKYASGHPSKRIFQAIRIEVNGELENLKSSIEKWVRATNKGGRICIITFHSLEDRIAKHTFLELQKDCVCPKSAPICVCGKISEVEVITKKPILATEEERKQNSRSESAKLRVAEKK